MKRKPENPRRRLERLLQQFDLDIEHVKREPGAKVDAKTKEGLTPLLQAAQAGYTAIVKLLIDGGANINSRNPKGETPLHLAAKNEDSHRVYDTVALLELKDADVNAADSHGNTVLHHLLRRQLYLHALPVLHREEVNLQGRRDAHGFSDQQKSKGIATKVCGRKEIDK